MHECPLKYSSGPRRVLYWLSPIMANIDKGTMNEWGARVIRDCKTSKIRNQCTSGSTHPNGSNP